tara:strand:- start:990 stop:1256 length:267 start_codon:yes stop_codon:yes gene_type:complete
MFKNIKSNLILFLFCLLLFCCCHEEDNKKELDDCAQILILVEDCMGLHRGALGYIESCGSLNLEVAKSYDTCEEVLDYFGIGDLPRNN